MFTQLLIVNRLIDKNTSSFFDGNIQVFITHFWQKYNLRKSNVNQR